MKLWIAALLLTPHAEAARPYVNDARLATQLETQVEMVPSPTNFSTPPLPSRIAVVVSDAVLTKDNVELPTLPEESPSVQMARYAGDKLQAAQTIKEALSPGKSPFMLLELGAGADIRALNRSAQDSLELLSLALEAQGEKSVYFVSLSAKGAIAAWNELVTATVDRLEALFADPNPDRAERQALKSFLSSSKTVEIRRILGSFRPN